jgi:hypothetical protein
MFCTSVRLSLNYLFQSYTRVLESISSTNCALSLTRISEVFTLSLARYLKIKHCAIAEGSTCTLIVITTDRKEADRRRYVVTVIGIPSLTTSKLIFLYVGISALDKNSGLY